MNNQLSEAIVLKRINYQESARIITFLTDGFGKVSLMAKGVRKSKSKLAGSVEVFSLSQITFLQGKGEVGTLVSARLIKFYPNILKDLERTQLGFRLIKLVDRNVEMGSGKELLDLLVHSFEALDDLEIDTQTIEFWFYLEFLESMGYMPNTSDLKQSSDTRSKKYVFDFDQMSFVDVGTGIYSLNHIKLFKLARQNKPKQLQRIQDINTMLPEANKLLVLMLRHNTFEAV